MSQNELSFDRWFVHLATLGPIGRIPKAPGTWGSLPALGLAWGLDTLVTGEDHWQLVAKLIIIVALSLVAFYSIQLTEAYWQEHDRGEIVIDELVGQFIPTVFFAQDIVLVCCSFIFFRAFDILKPGPVGFIDKNWPGAYGTLFDDLVAGIFALVCTAVLSQLTS